MKLESLIIIFIIIMFPIMLVLSQYIDTKVNFSQVEIQYNDKLLNSTYDAVKALQLNTVTNAFSDVTNSKVLDLEAVASTYYTSCATNFGYMGYNSNTMKDYIPALVLTLYDGYYIYSSYNNVLTSTDENKLNLSEKDASTGKPKNVAPEYENGKQLEGLKTYVYYNCRYVKGGDTDVVITYTLDNYITVQGKVKGVGYVYKYGYLVNGIKYNDSDKSYEYDGIKFLENSTESLSEYVGDKKYNYVKINGQKYYLDDKGTAEEDDDDIFYIDYTGSKNLNQAAGETNIEKKKKYIKAIKENKSAYEYYKNAYEFTEWVNNELGVHGENLKTSDAVTVDNSGNTISLQDEYGDLEIFDGGDYQSATSKFNQHRMAVIRYVIETNLSTAIAAFSSKANTTFIMPKIKDNDWDIIQNEVCAIGFMQGLPLGQKTFNSYAVVSNTLTKEYVDEDDIYIADDSAGVYYKANDVNAKTITNPKAYNKMDFEMRSYIDDDGIKKYFYPICIDSTPDPTPYKGSYTSIFGYSGIKPENIIKNENISDMYAYIKNCGNPNLKGLYYTALGRERWGSYHINNDLENIYFLKDY